MGLTEGNGLSVADIAAVTGDNRGGFGYDNGSYWMTMLFLYAIMFGGGAWGNGYGFGGGGQTAVFNADMQRGFDQQSVMNGINNLTNTVSNGFANAEISRCNTQANLTNQLNTIAMNQLESGCNNRAAIADLKYTIATEACADRAAVQSMGQVILDKMCQQELDAERRENQNLRTQLNMANLQASQTAQTARILADNSAQTVALEQYLNPTPVPAYMVQNPNCCSQTYNGCGCGA